jgi:hypothetical protein
VRVLYLSGATGADYQCDMLMHGLRSLLGADLVDAPRIPFMYRDWPHPPFYTVYSLLDDIPVDREDIPGKIRARYFDAVVYGSIQRYREHLPLVQECYPPNRIAYIDGEDDWSTVSPGPGHYFKRELTDQHPASFLPIEFCIPREKIRLDSPTKTRLMSPLIPGDTSTYIYYGNESAYYDQYAVSYFGRTRKKGGWDCCRHYEIMAAGCLPYFEGLESCPSRTMFRLPKPELLQARQLHDDNSLDLWEYLMTKVRAVLLRDLTTESMARYVLEKLT